MTYSVYISTNIIPQGDVEHQSASERSSRGVPTFKSPTVGIARDFGKRTTELEGEGINVSGLIMTSLARLKMSSCVYKQVELIKDTGKTNLQLENKG